jgi:hypothetical protein
MGAMAGPIPTSDPKVTAKKTTWRTKSSGSSSSGCGAAQVGTKGAAIPMSDPKAVAKKTAMTTMGAKEALDVTPDPKAVGKRITIGWGGSSPHKQFCTTWTCQGSRYVMYFESFPFLFFWVC